MKIPFPEVFADETKNGTKLKTSDYQTSGTYPIIDQGQDFIAGYTDSENGLYTDVPAIIFGDHTRVLKYVDFPFFLGADGAKILKACKAHANYRYLYYALKSVRISDTGYNRHFKWLKEATVSIPDSQKQESIVFTLDSISRIISHRKSQLAKLDELAKCRFVEMFGNPLDPKAKWKTTSFGSEFEIFSGGTPSTSVSEYWDNGTIPWIGSNMCQDVILSSTDGKYITEEGFNKSTAKWAHAGYVIVALVGATIGKTALLTISTTTNQNVASVNVPGNTNYTPEYVYMLMRFLYAKFMELGNGGFKMANLGFIRQLPLPSPPIDLQREYSDFMNRIDKLRMGVQAALDKAQTLFDSLMQEYFG